MKTLFIKGILFIGIITFLSCSTVNAKTIYYINLNGVEMTYDEYIKISNLFSEEKATSLSQEEFDKYINTNIMDSKVTYYKEIYGYNGIITSEEVSKEEYENSSEKKNVACDLNNRSSDYGYFETSYKKLSVNLVDFGNNYFQLIGNLLWKQVPYCRSYDVFAFRTTHMSYSSVTGIQTYYVGNNYTNISYNSSSSGYKSLSNGAGFSMNLKDDSNITKFNMSLLADLAINEFNYSQAHVFTSYQHAQSDLTQAQSKSYTLQAGGLGNVVYYSNSTIRNKYDGMTGIELTTPI